MVTVRFLRKYFFLPQANTHGHNHHAGTPGLTANTSAAAASTLPVVAEPGTPPHILSDDAASAHAPSPNNPVVSSSNTTSTSTSTPASSLAGAGVNLGSNSINGTSVSANGRASVGGTGTNSGVGASQQQYSKGFPTNGGGHKAGARDSRDRDNGGAYENERGESFG